MTDLAPLYSAADTLTRCAAQLRVQQFLVGCQGASVGWWGVAALVFGDTVDRLVGELAHAAARLDAFAEDVLSTAAMLQLESAVRH